MTGDYAPWGLPGLYGCEIIANDINAAGGVMINGESYMIEMVAYDHAYDTEKAVQGYKKLVLEDRSQDGYDAWWFYSSFCFTVGST